MAVHVGHGERHGLGAQLPSGHCARLKNADRLPVDALGRLCDGLVRAAAALRSLRGYGRRGSTTGLTPARSSRRRRRRRRRTRRGSTTRPVWANAAQGRAGRGGGLHRLQHGRTAVRPDAAGGFVRSCGSRRGRWSATAGPAPCAIITTRRIWRHLKPNDDWYPPSIFFQAMKYMYFGDPTLPFPAPAVEKK